MRGDNHKSLTIIHVIMNKYTFHLKVTTRKTCEVFELVLEASGNNWIDTFLKHVTPEALQDDCYEYQLLKVNIIKQ